MRNRVLLLPSNTPTDLFESSLENQVTFKQVKEIANFFNQLPVNIDFNRNNYVVLRLISRTRKQVLSSTTTVQTALM